MNNFCPNCLISDTYYSDAIPHGDPSEGKFLNKCINCNHWSLFTPGEGQSDLPEGLNEEDLNNTINNHN